MKHLAEKIKKLMAVFSHNHYEYMMFEEYGKPDFSNLSEEECYDCERDYEMEEQERKNSLSYIAKKLLPLVQAYIEAKHLPNYYSSFLAEIIPFYEKEKILLSTEDMDSELIHVYRKYLNAFDDFSITCAHKEFEILENILNSTAILLDNFHILPKSEADVYRPMANICKTAFPDNHSCSYKFQKTAKCYNPDILIPSLECAIEFKYVKDEKELNRTMDEILADVEGYKGNPSYTVFYSVFYATDSVCSLKRFNCMWEEKHFPENWKGIYVQGK
ncbi:MAG: hypothetical protein ACLTWD_09700 [Bacteroides uniformis]|jgi:hypothetical protein